MSGNAPGEGFLIWYSVKSQLFPHPIPGVGEWGDAIDRCIMYSYNAMGVQKLPVYTIGNLSELCMGLKHN